MGRFICPTYFWHLPYHVPPSALFEVMWNLQHEQFFARGPRWLQAWNNRSPLCRPLRGLSFWRRSGSLCMHIKSEGAWGRLCSLYYCAQTSVSSYYCAFLLFRVCLACFLQSWWLHSGLSIRESCLLGLERKEFIPAKEVSGRDWKARAKCHILGTTMWSCLRRYPSASSACPCIPSCGGSCTIIDWRSRTSTSIPSFT